MQWESAQLHTGGVAGLHYVVSFSKTLLSAITAWLVPPRKHPDIY